MKGSEFSYKFGKALKVEAREGEDVESLLSRFKRKCKKDGRFLEIRKWDYYVKPSDEKRMQKRRKKLSDGTAIKSR